MKPEIKTILYVDDDADDRELLWDAVQKVAPELEVQFAENGLLAMQLLHRLQAEKALPALIVLDLNMPFLDGRQTFEQIRADPQLKHIPLVVLSSGEKPSDKALFSREGVRYFTKPIKVSALEEIASEMAHYCV